MNTGFPTSQLSDGVHPNTQGYQEMAKRWYAIIGSMLPK
jgi:lysophospholipase L1-like esterase